MRKSIIAILIVCLFIVVLVAGGCNKEAKPALKTEGNVKKLTDMTEKERLQARLKREINVLDAAVVLDEDAVIEDSGYDLILSFKKMLAEGTSYTDLQGMGYSVLIGDPVSVKPADVSEKFAKLVGGVEVGGSSAILQIKDVGFGMIAVLGKQDNGEVKFGIIQVPSGATATITTPSADGASTDTGTTSGAATVAP